MISIIILTNQADVKINLLLPSAEAGIAYQVGGDLAYPEHLWMQQMAGGSRQVLAYDNYNYNSSESDQTWVNMYASAMNDLYLIIQKANQQNSPGYRGIGKVLMAYSLGCLTDLFGDIPYSQAFQGNANLSPIYDKQQTIYATINSLLTTAVTDLNTTPAFQVPVPGSDDLLYGGNLAGWIKADYALQARYALHLSKVPGSSAYTNALTALSAGAFTANTDDMEFHFGNNSNENAPIYQFLTQRGDCNASQYMVDTLINANDPRTSVFVDTILADGYGPQGQAPGNPGSGPSVGNWFAQIGNYYGAPNAPVPFISYVECLFIKAEAELPTNAAAAATDYNAAIAASLDKYGVTDATWLATYANATAANITLENIITQKYIALYLQLEVYNDWRRTGFPSYINLHKPVSNTTGNIVPRRYPYPTSEKEYNANCPKTGAELTNTVWWD